MGGRRRRRIRGGARGISSPRLGLSRLEWFGQRQRPDLPVVFPANGQGSGEIRLGLGQGGQRCLRLLEGGLILLAMGDQSVLIRGPLVHVGRRRVRQMGSVVQLLSLADDTVVEAPRLNPLCVFGQGGKGKASLSLEDCCQIGHQPQGVLLLESGPELPASPQVSEDWFDDLPELGWGYVRVVPSEEVAEEGEVIRLPALTFGHVGAFVVKRTRVPPLLSEGGSSPGAQFRGVHRRFLASLSLCGGLLGCRRGGGRVSWGPRLPITLGGCRGLGLPLGLRRKARPGLGASLRLGTPPSLRGLLGSRLTGAHLSRPLEPDLTTAPTLPLGGRASRGACGGGGVPSTGGTGRRH